MCPSTEIGVGISDIGMTSQRWRIQRLLRYVHCNKGEGFSLAKAALLSSPTHFRANHGRRYASANAVYALEGNKKRVRSSFERQLSDRCPGAKSAIKTISARLPKGSST